MNIKVEPHSKEKEFKAMSIAVEANKTIEDALATIIEFNDTVNKNEATLYFKGKLLKKTDTLLQVGITENCTVQLLKSGVAETKGGKGGCCFIY